MTWTAVAFIVIAIIFKMLMSPPSAVVGWVVSKFALHPKIDAKDVIVTYNGKSLEEEEKNRFTDYFNDALFLERNHIFPGNEKLFLNPETDVIPFIIHVKNKNKETKFYVYNNAVQVDVVKQWKKKVASYSLNSNLQKFTVSNRVRV